MRMIETPDGGLKLWLSARDTEDWATRPGASWPCSFLRCRALFAEFEGNGDLVDLAIDGGRSSAPGRQLTQGCPADELHAITTDYIATKYPDHPALRGHPQPV